MIAAARSLARSFGERTAAIAVLGHGVRGIADELAGYGLPVLLVDHPTLAEYTGDGYVQAIRAIVEEIQPRIVLAAHTSQGYDFAPALAGSLDLPLLTNCLALDFEDGQLVATRRLLNECTRPRRLSACASRYLGLFRLHQRPRE